MNNAFRVEITPHILKQIAEIDEFKGQWKSFKQLIPEKLLYLRQVATIESIGSSTRIEGAKLSNREVEQLLANIDIKSFKNRDEEEVAGYAEAMNLIFESYESIPLTENYIKQLHSILLKFSSKDRRHHGDYKKVSNHVEAFDSNKKSLGIVFKTATPFDTPQKMKELLDWTVQSLKESTLHPLLVIGIFIVHFLAIHPFQDGNGRLSRILTTLLLLQNGYTYVPFSSLESLVEQSKNSYYLALRKSQETLDTASAELTPWLVFFLAMLIKQKNILQDKMNLEQSLQNIPALSQELLNLCETRGRFTIASAVIVTKANRNTIKAHVVKLIDQGVLKQHGKGKGTWYTLS